MACELVSLCWQYFFYFFSSLHKNSPCLVQTGRRMESAKPGALVIIAFVLTANHSDSTKELFAFNIIDMLDEIYMV